MKQENKFEIIDELIEGYRKAEVKIAVNLKTSDRSIFGSIIKSDDTTLLLDAGKLGKVAIAKETIASIKKAKDRWSKE